MAGQHQALLEPHSGVPLLLFSPLFRSQVEIVDLQVVARRILKAFAEDAESTTATVNAIPAGWLGLDIGPAIAGLGVIGVAVGFGAQHLVRDYLNGALILIENQFSKGDVIRVAGVAGTVEDFSLRRTTLRDLDGVVHTVPNGEILVASNLTRVWSRINPDVVVAYGTDIDRATEVVDEVGRKMAADPTWKRRILEAPRVDRVAALGEYGVTLKILGTVRAPDQWSAAGELRKRLLAAFKEHGIEIPRPQRVILSRDPHAAALPDEALAEAGASDGSGDGSGDADLGGA